MNTILVVRYEDNTYVLSNLLPMINKETIKLSDIGIYEITDDIIVCSYYEDDINRHILKLLKQTKNFDKIGAEYLVNNIANPLHKTLLEEENIKEDLDNFYNGYFFLTPKKLWKISAYLSVLGGNNFLCAGNDNEIIFPFLYNLKPKINMNNQLKILAQELYHRITFHTNTFSIYNTKTKELEIFEVNNYDNSN